MNTVGKVAGGALAAVFFVCVGYSVGKHETIAHMNHHHHNGSHGEGHGKDHGKNHADWHNKFEAACADHQAACAEVMTAIDHDGLKADHDAKAEDHGKNHGHDAHHPHP